MTPSLVYSASGLLGAALGAAAGTTGAPPSALRALAPFGALLVVRRRLHWHALGIAAAVASLSWSIAALHHERATALQALARGVPRCDLSGSVHERFGNSGVVMSGSVRCEDGSTGEGRVYARLTAAPGSRVSGVGWLAPIGGDDGFDEMRARAGLVAEFHFDDVRRSPPKGVFAVAETFRSSLRGALTDDARGELALGLTIGETARFAPRDVEVLRAAGLSHLVAVSGSNVAIVLAAIGLLFAWSSRRARLAVAVVGLVSFVLVVGPEPSVLRAAAMAAVALAALATGTRSDPLAGLMLAVLLLLIVRPALVWSVGLHLSAAATAGIVLWSRPLENVLAVLPRPLRLPMAVTLAAQLAVTPVLVTTFGTLSLVAPVSNVLAVPAVAPATILALVAGCLQPVAPGPAAVPAALAEALCGWILAVGRRLGSSGWAEVTLGAAWALPVTLVVIGSAVAAFRGGRGD